jgi:broad specificity phosphatase PhoE
MHVTFVRHGESISNAAGIWQGHSNSELSERGIAQAEALAARLAGSRFDRIVCSDLRRAAHTADIVGSALGMTALRDPAWREINLGRWEGLTRASVREQFPDEVAALGRGEDIQVGGGERWSDLGRRVGAAFEVLVQTAEADEHILVVVHGGVIVTFFATLLGVLRARPRPIGKLSNTSLSRVGIHDGALVVESYNDALHIDAQASWHTERDDRGRSVVALRAQVGSRALAANVHQEHPAGEGLAEVLVEPEGLAAWANARLPGDGRATIGVPAPGGRCLSVASLPEGTIWSWNEGSDLT